MNHRSSPIILNNFQFWESVLRLSLESLKAVSKQCKLQENSLIANGSVELPFDSSYGDFVRQWSDAQRFFSEWFRYIIESKYPSTLMQLSSERFYSELGHDTQEKYSYNYQEKQLYCQQPSITACSNCRTTRLCGIFAQIIMIPKPGKSANEVNSSRPISLLPVTSKLFEKLLLKRIRNDLDLSTVIPDYQLKPSPSLYRACQSIISGWLLYSRHLLRTNLLITPYYWE
jgi:hypothetical protein